VRKKRFELAVFVVSKKAADVKVVVFLSHRINSFFFVQNHQMRLKYAIKIDSTKNLTFEVSHEDPPSSPFRIPGLPAKSITSAIANLKIGKLPVID